MDESIRKIKKKERDCRPSASARKWDGVRFYAFSARKTALKAESCFIGRVAPFFILDFSRRSAQVFEHARLPAKAGSPACSAQRF